jgi:hypothetical protein
MKKMKRWSKWMLLASAGVVGCQSDVDTTLPEITQVIVDGLESETHSIQAGESMQISLMVSDNENLKQVKVNVHAADDGHGHGSGSGVVLQPNVGTWNYSSIIELTGQSATANLSLSVPADIIGSWHLEIMAIDESGNEAIEKVVTLSVNNDELPVIQVTTSPAAFDNVISVSASNPVLSLDATVVDASGIDSLYILAATEGGVEVFTQSFDASDVLEFNTGTIEITFPGVGLYDIELRALDVNGYENILMREVQVQ